VIRNKTIVFALLIFPIAVLSGCSGSGSKKEKVPAVQGNAGTSLKGPEIDIYSAALEGDLAKVKAAIENGQKANSTDQEGRTALMYSAYDGRTEILKLLLANGAEVNLKDNAGRTALMMASSGPFPDAVTLLLDKFADPNITDRVDHFSAIMFAASEGQLEVVKILLSRGADPSFKDKDGDTAESFATKNGHKEVVALLKSFKK
jgi:ankyrin repeat protein